MSMRWIGAAAILAAGLSTAVASEQYQGRIAGFDAATRTVKLHTGREFRLGPATSHSGLRTGAMARITVTRVPNHGERIKVFVGNYH